MEGLDDQHGNEDEEEIPTSVDLIEDGLYLGNYTAACSPQMLKELKITHILTIDTVPLPLTIRETMPCIFKFIQMADVRQEDLITHLPECVKFIKESISSGGTVLVHCYFGVSRSGAVVVAYAMSKYGVRYEDALAMVRARRRYVSPNAGFVAQLKLFGRMGCTIDNHDPRFKQFRLKLAGQMVRRVKILPQSFADLIKPDPGLTRERPEPLVYRCKKCRRIVAARSNLIPHIPKQLKIELARKQMGPQSNKQDSLACVKNEQTIIERLNRLTFQKLADHQNKKVPAKIHHYEPSVSEVPLKTQVDEGEHTHRSPLENVSDSSHANETLEQITETNATVHKQPERITETNGTVNSINLESKTTELIRTSEANSHGETSNTNDKPDETQSGSDKEDPENVEISEDPEEADEACIVKLDGPEACKEVYFVEPMAWMDVAHESQGKLHCPKCATKIGSFSWLMGCRCPCGQKVAPAFYLVPSKVEWSNVVQNVQATI